MSNRDIRQRLPSVGLTALLLEIDAGNEFSGAFFPVSKASAYIDDLQAGISSLLLAEAAIAVWNRESVRLLPRCAGTD